MLKLGIIGAGRLGSFHADKAAAHSNVDLVGIADPSVPARTSLAEKHGIRAFASADDLLPLVDAVVIASPTSIHYEHGIACLEARKHVLLEKPMTDSLFDAQKLVDAARRYKVVLQVGHVEEFNPAWQTAQNSLREAQIGKPVFINAVRTGGYTFRSTDVGTVFDMMIHDIDLILSLIPAAVSSVDAVGFNVIGGPHEDTAHARILFENGSVANLYSSRIAPKAIREMTISSANGNTTIDFASRTATVHRPDHAVLHGEFAPVHVLSEAVPSLVSTFMTDHFVTNEIRNEAVDALAAELDDFVETIESHSVPRVSGERALRAVAVAETIVHSLTRRANTGTKRKAA
jgi:predicted dehydrogenase